MIEAQLTISPTCNAALEQCGVPIVSAVTLRNAGSRPLTGGRLVVSIGPDLLDPVEIPLPPLHGGEVVDLGPLDLRLPAGRLRGVLEAEPGELRWGLVDGEGAEVAGGAAPIRLLAFNEWPGLRAPPALLAAFVLPNHPALGPLLVAVRDRLQAATGDAAIDGYQGRSPARARAQVEALYAAVQALGLSYVGAPASFEAVGQKVRLPDRLLADQMGNCLDITLLVAAAIEQMRLAPLLVIVAGHAFPGVWLEDDRFPEGTVDDAPRLRNLIALGQVVVFDSSTLVGAGAPSFAQAVAVAQAHLAEDGRFIGAVDVRVARLDGVRPLALRAEAVPEVGAPLPMPVVEGVPALPMTPAAPAPSEPVAQRFRKWKERLLDLSLRNRLLHFRPGVGGSLPLAVPDLGRFEDLLVTDTVFTLLPAPTVDPRDGRDPALVAARVVGAEREALLRAELDSGRLLVGLSAAELHRRAVDLDRAARAAIEEGGANTLFAAVGLLSWYESAEAKEPRLAPLLLVPVRLEYERRSQRICLRRTAEDAVGNVTLAEKMSRDFGLDLSALTALGAEERGVDVAGLLQAVRGAIARMPRWELREEVHLGAFTFTRFLMWRDLEDNAAALLSSEVVRHIASGGADPFVDPVGEIDPATLDATVAPDQLPTVVDADSTQMRAVVAALRGRSFVLQGPPGTGKSQTITNLIAGALGEGKTVLFVSEKMAALDVVQRRLQAVGLGDYCLELHSNKTSKQGVLRALGAVWERGAAPGGPSWAERCAELATVRAGLNAYAAALHAPRPVGMSLHALTGRLLRLEAAPLVSLGRVSADFSEAALRERVEAAGALSAAARAVGSLVDHPLAGCAGFDWGFAAEERVVEALGEAVAAAEALEKAGQTLSATLGASPPRSREGLVDLAAVGMAVSPLPAVVLTEAWNGLRERALAHAGALEAQRATQQALALRWRPGLYTAPLASLAAQFRAWAGGFFLLAWIFLFLPRRALRPLAASALPDDRQIADDLARALGVADKMAPLAAETQALQALFAGAWASGEPEALRACCAAGEALRATLVTVGATPGLEALLAPALPADRRERVRAEAAALTAALARAAAAQAAVEAGLGVSLGDGRDPETLGRLTQRSRRSLAARGQMRSWCLFQASARAAEALGLGPLVAALREGRLDPAVLPAAVERALLHGLNMAIRDAEPALRGFDGEAQERRVARFRALDREHVQLSRAEVLRRLDAGRAAIARAEVGEPGLLARELRKQRGHLPIRKLLAGLPNLLPRLKPCLLMSPLSVAQYLPADGRRFDLVVFDEASQIGTHDAIGAIARGKQVVIVGDSKQLPPTAFFQREGAAADALPDDNDIIELESILDEALAARLPEQMLGWHYRSRHESLIDFSNQHSYEGRLNVFPAARGRADDLGLRWTHVPGGVYDKGGTRANRKEAEALVAHLVAALARTAPGSRSFGVVTFSQPQQTLVADLLDQARAAHPAIEGHFAEGLTEPVFVKNLENVQGDERDVILFSIGYGPDAAGKVWMNFGPLNRSGGERRLNVAVTRARQENHVFSTLTADQIDTRRTTAKGAAHLKAFLQQAAARAATRGALREEDFATPLEERLQRGLSAQGHQVDCRVGCGAYRVDLALLDPDDPSRYLLGVEGDGPAYALAATARDRDRLRAEVLGSLGWRLHRVWSTEQWMEPDRAAARLQAAIATAEAAPPPLPPPPPPVEAPLESAAPSAPPPPLPRAPAWQRAQLPERVDKEGFFEARALRLLIEQVGAVAAVEAPLSLTELSRRVAGAWGHKRLTDRVRRRVLDAVEAAEQARQGTRRGDFYWRLDQDPDALTLARGPAENGEVRDPDDIADEELAAGALVVLRGLLSAPQADLLRELARSLGLGVVGPKLRGRLEAGVDRLVAQGRALREGDRVALPR